MVLALACYQCVFCLLTLSSTSGVLDRQLQPVTQLYVSVDAATRDGLKAIDRPLFKDFWQRFLDCLTELRDKRQRTVYRCTPMPTPRSSEHVPQAEGTRLVSGVTGPVPSATHRLQLAHKRRPHAFSFPHTLI